MLGAWSILIFVSKLLTYRPGPKILIVTVKCKQLTYRHLQSCHIQNGILYSTWGQTIDLYRFTITTWGLCCLLLSSNGIVIGSLLYCCHMLHTDDFNELHIQHPSVFFQCRSAILIDIWRFSLLWHKTCGQIQYPDCKPEILTNDLCFHFLALKHRMLVTICYTFLAKYYILFDGPEWRNK